MKHTLRSALASLLICTLSLTAIALFGCSEEQPDTPDTTPTPTATPTETVEPEVTRIPLDLPEKTFGGATFHVAEWSVGGATEAGTGWIPWEEIDIDTMDGDLLAEAVFARNNAVEEKYDVVITKEYISVDQGYYDKIMLNDMTGEDAWQLMTERSIDIASYISAHLLTDMNELEQLNLEADWWVADSVDSLTLGDHLYFAANETLMRDKGATACTFFNKEIAANNGITDLYALVDSGDWTLEAMTTYGAQVAASLDGDDLLNSSDDMWGWICNASGNGVFYLIVNGMGQKYGTINDSGEFEFTYNTTDCISVIQRVLNEFMFADAAFSAEAGMGGAFELFTSGHCLFHTDLVRATTSDYRSMEADYGILPCPKEDELQDSYSSFVFHHHSSVLGIPSVVADKEMAATVTEALAWESYYTVYPQFFDTVLMSRNTRDEESQSSLALVFATRSFDCGLYYNGNMTSVQDKIYNCVNTRTDNVTSLMESCEGQIETFVSTVNDWMEED